MEGDLVFRDADPSEDDELARIMYNAFLPIWNHNWFQCLTSPLDLIPSTTSPLTNLQARRLAFYRSWIALVRVHSGVVALAYTPHASSPSPQIFTTSPSNSIAAIVLLLPPHCRPTWFSPLIAYRTNLLPSLFGLSLRGVYRIAITFEGNVHRLIAAGLRARAIGAGNEANLIMCHGCVRNPQWEGSAPARRLLDWAIRRWWKEERERGGVGTPVWLDTSVEEGVRAYQEVGFEVLGSCEVETGADEVGIRLREGVGEEERARARVRSRQWVMVRVPSGEGEGGGGEKGKGVEGGAES